MNVTDEFDEIGVFLAENRLIAVLEELTVTVMSLIEDDRVTGEEAGHDRMEGNRARLQEQMGVIAEERPCVTGGVGVGEYLLHSFDKAVLVDIITEDQSPLDAADNDMVEHAFGVETAMAGHGQSYQTENRPVKSYLVIYGRPPRSPVPGWLLP